MSNNHLVKETNPISISDQAFSIPLILANIFSYVALKNDIIPLCLVNRWWNQLATERLYYRFKGLKNNSRTRSFEKFKEILQRSHSYFSDPTAHPGTIHEYGRYVKILDLERLKIKHEVLLETLDCCPRIEQLIMGNNQQDKIPMQLDETQMYNIAKRLPELKSFKFNDIDISDGNALGAIAKYCLKLEELNLKKDISCNGNVLLEITKNCRRLTRLDIEEKYYEDEVMIPSLSNCPDLMSLKIHQCISFSETFLLSIYKSCPKLTDVAITNVSEITTDFAIETFKHFKNAKKLTIYHVDRYLESKIQANEQSIIAHLYDTSELGRIIHYFRNNDDDEYANNKKPHLLKELALMEFPILNKVILKIICEGIDQLTKLELSGAPQELSKSEVLEIIPKLKNIRHFSIRFSYPVEPLLDEDTGQLFKKCSQLEFIQWQMIRHTRNENPALEKIQGLKI